MPGHRIDLNPAPRRFRVRSLMVVVALTALVMAGGKWLFWQWNYRGKVQYCRGWGTQHAAQAKEFWRKAADPKLSKEDAQEFRMEARRRAIMARKYLAVAADPTLPYPGTPYPSNPLLTPEEIAKEPDQAVDP
jgi:hypothetical protein